MKIETSILPRKDGTVKATVEDVTYEFKPDENGWLVCDVANEKHLAFLLSRADDFIPADEADFTKAADLAATGDNEEVEAADDEVNMDAPPIEEPRAKGKKK